VIFTPGVRGIGYDAARRTAVEDMLRRLHICRLYVLGAGRIPPPPRPCAYVPYCPARPGAATR